MRLPQRRHVLREQIPFPELSERETCRFILRRPSADQLPPAVLEMLRELIDDLVLSRRREAQRRQGRRGAHDSSA